MKGLKLKNLKQGEIFTKKGFVIYWSAGNIVVTAYKFFVKVSTLKEAKEEIKNFLNNYKPINY